MATSKLSRPENLSKPSLDEIESSVVLSEYDFGELDTITVDITENISLTFKEPTAEDYLKLQEFEKNPNLSEMETTLYTICLLHTPDPGKGRISMKEAKKLTAKQLKRIGDALKELTSDMIEEEQLEEDFKS